MPVMLISPSVCEPTFDIMKLNLKYKLIYNSKLIINWVKETFLYSMFLSWCFMYAKGFLKLSNTSLRVTYSYFFFAHQWLLEDLVSMCLQVHGFLHFNY